MVFTSLDEARLDYKEPLHALYAAKKLNDTDRKTDRQTDIHRHFKSSDGAKNHEISTSKVGTVQVADRPCFTPCYSTLKLVGVGNRM